jgi:hypothetical protein
LLFQSLSSIVSYWLLSRIFSLFKPEFFLLFFLLLQESTHLTTKTEWLAVGWMLSVVGATVLAFARLSNDRSCNIMAWLTVAYSSEAEPSGRGAAELAFMLNPFGTVLFTRL